jgi:hypothetical protein
LRHDWERSPHYLRSLLTEKHVSASDRRARFVGVDAYVAAGGTLERDLFDEENEGCLADPALLDRLVTERSASLVADLEVRDGPGRKSTLALMARSRYTSVMKLMQLPILFAAIRVFHIFKDALPFGISIGARPAIDERGILDFEEQKSIRLSNKRSAAHLDQKKREADRFVFLSTSECANDWSRARGVFVAETDG